jgi:hypothetical protein
MYKFLMLLLPVAWCACTNNTTTETTTNDTVASAQTIHNNITDTVVTTAKPIALNGCYQMILKKDTALLSLAVHDSTVTGNLQYHWYARDANHGTIKGVLRNNTIYADYTFRSEGLTSVREVVFKVVNDQLVLGYGDLTEQNGKVIFRNKEALQFQTANPFLKVVCP